METDFCEKHNIYYYGKECPICEIAYLWGTHMLFMERAIDKINGNGKIHHTPVPEAGASCSIVREEECES